MTKKVISIILALILMLSVFSVLPMTASAEEADVVDVAADEEIADTSATELTITKQPPTTLTISYHGDNDSNPIYPYIVFGVRGGSGSYTYNWYYDGDSDSYTFNKVATTTVPVYQVDKAGYWHCVVSDGSKTILTEKTKVKQYDSPPKTKVRLNGTKIEWLENRSEKTQPHTYYALYIYRKDTTHGSTTMNYYLRIRRNDDNTIDRIGQRDDGAYVSNSEWEQFAPTYSTTKHMYSIDIKCAIEKDKSFDDIEYEFVFYSPGYTYPSDPSYIKYKPVKQLYSGELHEYADGSQERTGEIRLPSDIDYQAGDTVTVNLNGGRWGNQAALRYSICSQVQVNGEWQDYQQGSSFVFPEEAYGKSFRFKLKPTVFSGRIAGEYYWDDEYFVSNGLYMGKKVVTVSGTVNCTFTEPKAGAAADPTITITDSNNGKYYELADSTSSKTGLDWYLKDGGGRNYHTFESGETYTAKVYLRQKEDDQYTYKIDYDNFKVYFNGKLAANYQQGNYLRAEMDYPVSDGSGFTVSGTQTSYLYPIGTVVFQLLQGDAVKYTATVTGNTGSYSIENVAAGSYTLRVSKKDHTTRDYTITVSGDMTQDVKICPLGDVTGDGKVTNADYSRVNQHVCKTKLLTDYALLVGDVAGSVGVTNADLARINQHVCKTKPLW